jgi:iron-sulfur cluster assembly accessory protein
MSLQSAILSDELNQIKESSKKPIKFIFFKNHSLKITENCLKKINEFQNENPDKLIRIVIEGGGCQGFQYKFVDDSISMIGQNGRDILLCADFDEQSPGSLSKPIIVFDLFSEFYIKDSTLEYENSLLFQGFLIKNNPKAKSSCGCKKSFYSEDSFEQNDNE